ncbi:MAG: TonB-dependent receptor [Marinilabiliaceae bacterium]|nr:TonB-dependent receptor [Marinilabiliaceae bacterium]
MWKSFYVLVMGILLSFNILAVENNIDVNLKTALLGKVKDGKSGEFIEYATIALYKQSDKSVVDGTVTNVDGDFQITRVASGLYYAEVSYLGYNTKTISDIEIEHGKGAVDLGVIVLSPSAETLNEIEVIGERKSFEYKIDKKVINVGKQFSSASMSAIEVLENVPSVKVDIEGNVSLRGSSGFTVLIDGKPTMLDPSDALQQIPANTIENIEIITNPSAKYQPDGTAGIINVITKGNKLLGVNGQLTLHGGMYNRKGGELLLNYRSNKVNYFLSTDYNYNEHPGNSSSERITYLGDEFSSLISNGNSDRQRERWSFNGGVDIDISEKDILSLGGRYGFRQGSNDGITSYRKFSSSLIIDTIWNETYYDSYEDSYRDGDFFSFSGNYQHQFKTEGHDLKFQFNYGKRTGDERSMNETLNELQEPVDGRINYESGPGERTEIRLDYTLPFNNKNKLEVGYQGRYSYGIDNTGVDSLDISSLDYVRLSKYGNSTSYDEDITGLYGIYSGEQGFFGYQIGLRSEYTSRMIKTTTDDNKFTIDDWDFFPTLHLSYNFPNDHQVMASYSRRIERPRGWQLEPFITWRGAYSVRMGNPDLKSQYIDSYEIGYLKEMESAYFSLEGYYRHTNNKIEFIQSVYTKDVLMSKPQNVGDDNALGVEASVNITKIKWWEMNLMGDVYNYNIEGERNGVDFSNSSFNWGARLNNTFKLPLKSQLQFNMRYNSPSVTAQGRDEGFFEFNSAYRIDLFKRKVSAIIEVRDLFATAKHERTLKDDSFYSHYVYEHQSPFVSFTISYRINNYNPKRERVQGADNSSNGDGDDF